MARTQAKKETTANKETTPAPTIKIANPRCPKCGQARVQIEYELRHAAAKKAKAGKKTA